MSGPGVHTPTTREELAGRITVDTVLRPGHVSEIALPVSYGRPLKSSGEVGLPVEARLRPLDLSVILVVSKDVGSVGVSSLCSRPSS